MGGALALGADRPGHRRGRRRAGARGLRPGRRLAAHAEPGGWTVTASAAVRACARARRRRHPRPRRRRPRPRAVRGAAAGHRPAGAGGVRRPGQPGAGVPPAARARRAGRRAGEGRGDLHRAAARRLPRPAHPAGHDAGRRRRAPGAPTSTRPTAPSCVAALDGSADQLERLIDDLLDLSRLESGLVHPDLRPRSLDEVLPLAVAGHPPGAVEPRGRRDPPARRHRRRAAGAGRGQPGRQRRAPLDRDAGPGPGPRAARQRRGDGGRPRAGGAGGAARADVRGLPAPGRRDGRTASAWAWPSPAG